MNAIALASVVQALKIVLFFIFTILFLILLMMTESGSLKLIAVRFIL